MLKELFSFAPIWQEKFSKYTQTVIGLVIWWGIIIMITWLYRFWKWGWHMEEVWFNPTLHRIILIAVMYYIMLRRALDCGKMDIILVHISLVVNCIIAVLIYLLMNKTMYILGEDDMALGNIVFSLTGVGLLVTFAIRLKLRFTKSAVPM